ncbi:MAG TPA: hypothetical protein DCS93_17350 [Microscillaceae bacterium]|nr:hypothetical protein [Microscillaceae bacterium]
MNKSEYITIINVSKEKTWEVLFNQYGDIHIHNPTMQSSNYLNGGTEGELNSVRHCKFSDKLFLDEKITEVNGSDSFTIVVTNHNLPFVNEMSATYELRSINDDQTELKMISFNSFSPGFMKYVMRKPMGKSLLKHLFGLKYYLETGKVVTKENYSKTFNAYK